LVEKLKNIRQFSTDLNLKELEVKKKTMADIKLRTHSFVPKQQTRKTGLTS